MTKNIFFKILFFVAIFAGSFLVWYSPVLIKGYAPYKMSELVPLAKNLHQTGLYSMEDDRNVFLAPSLIKEKGHLSTVGNKFTACLYSWLFKLTGKVWEPQNLVLFSVFLTSLSLLVFSLLVFLLFGWQVSLIFSLIYIFLPFIWSSIYSLGTYEFAFLFFSVFSLLFWLNRDKKYDWFSVFFSGIFLALAAFSRETFFLTVPLAVAYLWFFRSKKTAVAFVVPVVILVSVFYLPSFFREGGGNYYFNMFFTQGVEKNQFRDFNFYGHLYPDPYTYHFEKEKFLGDYSNQMKQAGFLDFLRMKKVLVNMGEESANFFERLSLGVFLFAGHLSDFFSVEELAGPFALFFIVPGMFYLRNRNRELFNFSLLLILGATFLMSFAVVVSRSHLRDFNWLVALFISLGIMFFAERMKKRKFVVCLLLCFLLSNFLFGNYLNFKRIYGKERAVNMELYAQKIKEAGVPDNDTIAIGLDSKDQLVLNYLAGKSTVIFTPESIDKLITEGKLKEGFEFFGVKYILGYDENLSAEIIKNSGVKPVK
jgi:hypothetical protein